MLILFWTCCFVLFYHLIGYPLILLILTRISKNNDNTSVAEQYPSITVLCPAYNEVDVIESKINSFLELNYPKDKINMIVISDDSTDGTNEIVEKFSKQNENIKLVVQKPRKGKPSGHNLVRSSIKSDYVISTDANSIFDPEAVNQLLSTFSIDSNIGIVSGCLRLQTKGRVDSGEGLYWKYESRIKEWESKFHSILGSNGSIFMIKCELFKEVHPASVDDFERTLQVLSNKNIGKYNKNALVYEYSTEKPNQEIKRKIRIISREWFALLRNHELLNPFKFTKISIMLWSHKLFRWLLGFFTIGILVSSIALGNDIFYMLIAISTSLVLTLGFIELNLENKQKSISFLKPCAYFTAMNYAATMAFLRFLAGKQQSTWNTIREEK